VEGNLFGRPLYTHVDNKLAATMLINPQDSNVIKLFESYRDVKLDNELLGKITKEYSLDVSTLFFLEKLYEQTNNRQLQDYYLSTIETLSGMKLDEEMSFLQDFYIFFIPAFRYDYNVGNFLQQRQLLDSAKILYEIIKTDPWGLVEDNAEIVAKRLQELNKLYRNIIIISASKGSLEANMALGKILKPDELTSVRAWINVCGILKGSFVADYWAAPIRKWWLKCGLFFTGERVDPTELLKNISYTQRIQDTLSLTIPKNIYTVNLLAVHLGQKNIKRKNNLTNFNQEQKKYCIKTITQVIPNDGSSPLFDEIANEGNVVIEMGTRHTFEGVDMNTRMIALLRYIVDYLKYNNFIREE
jgi:hypothetical protein